MPEQFDSWGITSAKGYGDVLWGQKDILNASTHLERHSLSYNKHVLNSSVLFLLPPSSCFLFLVDVRAVTSFLRAERNK